MKRPIVVTAGTQTAQVYWQATFVYIRICRNPGMYIDSVIINIKHGLLTVTSARYQNNLLCAFLTCNSWTKKSQRMKILTYHPKIFPTNWQDLNVSQLILSRLRCEQFRCLQSCGIHIEIEIWLLWFHGILIFTPAVELLIEGANYQSQQLIPQTVIINLVVLVLL